MEAAVADDSTRAKLLAAAVQAFSRSSYEDVSIRAVERSAGANRGLVAYHFGSKEGLWKAAIGWLMSSFHDEMEHSEESLRDVAPMERGRVLLKVATRFHAKHPEYFRILVLNGNDDSDRTRWLADEYLARNNAFFHRIAGDEETTDRYASGVGHYIFNGAAAIFAQQSLCRRLFGFDPSDPQFIEQYALLVADLYRPDSEVMARIKDASTPCR